MSLLKSGIGLAAAQLLEKVLTFGIVLLASRTLKTDGIGEFFYYFSLVSLFFPLMDLGLQKLLVQRWFKNSEEQRKVLVTRLFVLKLFGGTAALLASLLVDAIVRWGHPNPQAVFACFIAIFSVSMGNLLRRPRFINDRIELEIGVPILSRSLTFIGVLLLLHRFVHGYQLAYVYAVSNCVGMLVSAIGLSGYGPTKWRSLDAKPMRELVKDGIPFSLTSLFVMLSLYIDSVMLGRFSLGEVGAYGAAYRVVLVVAGLSGSTAHILFPRIVRMNSGNDKEAVGRMLGSVLRVHLMLFGVLTLGGIIMGKRMMIGLYGDEFAVSGLPFQILCGLIFLVGFTNVIGHTLEAMEMQKRVLSITLRAALFNFLANLVLIPVWGMIGAAITTVLTEFIVLLCQLKILRKLPHLWIAFRQLRSGLLFLIPVAVIFSALPILANWLEPLLPIPSIATWIALGCGGGAVVVFFLSMKSYWLRGLIDETQHVESKS